MDTCLSSADSITVQGHAHQTAFHERYTVITRTKGGRKLYDQISSSDTEFFFFFTVGLLRPFNELILAVNLQKWGAFSKNYNTKPISCRTQLRKKPVHGHFTNTQCSGLLHAGIQNPAITDYKASCFHSIPSQALPIYECSQQIQNLPTGKWVSKLWDISDRSRWNLCQQFSALPQDSQPWVLTHHVASNYGKSVFELRKGEFTVQYYFKLTLTIKN